MKKIILCLTLALMSATTMFAVKAKPGITQLQLVDGTIVSATLHGDEHFSYYSLLDGTPLKKSDNGKYEIISTETLNAVKLQLSIPSRLEQAALAQYAQPIFLIQDRPRRWLSW